VRAGTPALELGAGVVRHTWNMFVSKDNTRLGYVGLYTMLKTALRVDFMAVTLGRRHK
jgi:hypothetical protein